MNQAPEIAERLRADLEERAQQHGLRYDMNGARLCERALAFITSQAVEIERLMATLRSIRTNAKARNSVAACALIERLAGEGLVAPQGDGR